MPTTPGPEAFLLFRDANWQGADSLVSVTSENGLTVGPVVPATANQGTLVGVQSGSPSADAEVDYYLLGGGFGGAGGWLSKASSEASTKWRAINALTTLWREVCWQTSESLYAQDVCVSTTFSRLIGAWVDSTGAVRIEIQDATLPFGTFTHKTIAMSGESADITKEGGVGVCELVDGTLLCCYQQQDSTTGFLNINSFISQDGGDNWTLVHRRLLTRTSIGVLGSSGGQYQLRASGDWIRLVFNSSAVSGVGIATAVQKTLVSSDRGASWSVVANLTTYPWKAPNGYAGSAPTALVGLGDVSGSFLLAYTPSLGSGTVRFAFAQRTDAWAAQTALDFDCSSYAATARVKGLAAAREADRLWFFVWVEGSDKSEIIARICTNLADPLNTANWVTLGQISGLGGVLRYGPHCFRAAWTGARMVLSGGIQDPDVGATADPLVDGHWMVQSGTWELKPWDYSMLDVSQNNYLLSSSASRLMEYQWWPCSSSPAGDATNSDGLTPWTRATAGTITATWFPDRQYLATTDTAGYVYYSLNLGTPSASNRWGSTGVARGFCIHFGVKLFSTRAAPGTAEDCGIKITAMDSGGANGYTMTLRIGATTVVFYDDTGAASKVSVSTTAFTARVDVRIWGRGSSWGFSFRGTGADDTWTDYGPYTFTSGAVPAQGIRMGILAATGPAGTSEMELYDFGVSYQTDASQRSDIDKPQELVGTKLNKRPILVRNGISAQWGGSGAYSGDTYTGSLYRSRGSQNLSIDSPRSYWESTDLALQSLVFWAGSGSAIWQMDSLLLVGTVDRTCLLEMNATDSWGAPSFSTTLSADLHTGLTVSAVSGSTVTFTSTGGTWPPRRGSLVGCYLRFTSGAISGQTFQILSDSRRSGAIHVAGGFNLASLGAAVSDTAVIFGDRMLWKTGAPKEYAYFRLVFPNLSSTTRGTYTGTHRVGAMVPGFFQQFTVPLEWSFRDNQQPNLTQLRTRGGASWQMPEGPAQRVVDARIVGDVNDFRRSLRDMLREYQGFAEKPCGLLLDDALDPDRTVLLYGRWSSGSQMDEAAWYQDTDGIWRTAGDVDFVFTEEV